MKYEVKFRHDDWSDCRIIETPFKHYDAAEEFAEYAYDHMDMWEHSSTWDGDDCIDVRCEGLIEKSFIIHVEFNPSFCAQETEKKATEL